MTSGPWSAEVSEQASAWLARLQREVVTEAEGMAFDAWLDASPDHREAYRAVLAIWHAFGVRADQS